MTARMSNPAFAVAFALVVDIATVNLWNRLDTATQQVVGEHGG